MTVLVAGSTRVDAGKTTFATGLLARLRATGDTPIGFKPRAGNDYWFDHDDVRAAAAEGRLYGKDVRRLAAVSDGDDEPEGLNPVHRLWRPTPGRTGMLGDPERTFLVDRVTTDDGPLFAVNAEAELPASLRESLPLDDAVTVDSVPAFNDLMAERYLPALERLEERVAATETAVVESYGDVALPLSSLDASAVAVVDPGRVRIYDGERYLLACDVASGSAHEGRLEERVEDVVDMLDPLETVPLPALTSAERGDPETVAERYAAAYDGLLGAV